MDTVRRQPERLLALPMYVALALSREGYRYGLNTGTRIRMPHYAVMATLAEFGPCSQRSVAESTGFDKSDITKIINDLEADGFVARQTDTADARRHRVALTEAGTRQLARSDHELNTASRAFFGALSKTEYQQLTGLLLKAIGPHDQSFRTPMRARGRQRDVAG